MTTKDYWKVIGRSLTDPEFSRSLQSDTEETLDRYHYDLDINELSDALTYQIDEGARPPIGHPSEDYWTVIGRCLTDPEFKENIRRDYKKTLTEEKYTLSLVEAADALSYSVADYEGVTQMAPSKTTEELAAEQMDDSVMSGPQFRENLQLSLNYLGEELLRRAGAHDLAAQFNGRIHYGIGVPTAALAAIGGVSAFSQYEIVAGFIAIIVAALTSVATILNPQQTARQHQERAQQCESLARRAQSLWTEVGLSKHMDDLTRMAERKSKLENEKTALGEPHPALRYKRRIDKKLEAENDWLFSRL